VEEVYVKFAVAKYAGTVTLIAASGVTISVTEDQLREISVEVPDTSCEVESAMKGYRDLLLHLLRGMGRLIGAGREDIAEIDDLIQPPVAAPTPPAAQAATQHTAVAPERATTPVAPQQAPVPATPPTPIPAAPPPPQTHEVSALEKRIADEIGYKELEKNGFFSVNDDAGVDGSFIQEDKLKEYVEVYQNTEVDAIAYKILMKIKAMPLSSLLQYRGIIPDQMRSQVVSLLTSDGEKSGFVPAELALFLNGVDPNPGAFSKSFRGKNLQGGFDGASKEEIAAANASAKQTFSHRGGTRSRLSTLSSS